MGDRTMNKKLWKIVDVDTKEKSVTLKKVKSYNAQEIQLKEPEETLTISNHPFFYPYASKAYLYPWDGAWTERCLFSLVEITTDSFGRMTDWNFKYPCEYETFESEVEERLMNDICIERFGNSMYDEMPDPAIQDELLEEAKQRIKEIKKKENFEEWALDYLNSDYIEFSDDDFDDFDFEE